MYLIVNQKHLSFLLCFLLFIPVHISGIPDSLIHPKPIPEPTSIETAESLLRHAKQIENNNPDRSLTCTNKVLRYALIKNNPLLQARAQLQAANLYAIKTQFTDAMKMAMQARIIAEKLGAEIELAEYYEISGRIKTRLGNYEESLEDLFKALQYFEKNKDNIGASHALNSIGSVSYWKKDYNKAMTYFLRAQMISNQLKDTVEIARSINNVGLIYMARKEYQKALEVFSIAMAYNQKSGQLLRVGGNMLNIAINYSNLKNFPESYKNYQGAMVIFNQLENYLNASLCYLDLGYYYENLGDQDMSKEYFRKTFHMGRKYGFKTIEVNAVEKLQEIFFKEKNKDSAYAYSIIQAELKDSLAVEKSKTRFSIAELQYEYSKREQEVRLDHQRKNFISIIIGFVLIFFVIIAILVISRQVQKNRAIALEKKNLTDELEFKNKELTMNVMNLLKRNEFIIDTSRRLLEISPDQQSADMKDEITKIAKSLQDETDKETWEEFELRFKQVHSGFYERLLSQFPELSPNELKMCGLLRLNLTTKEISELTGQRRETIEMARFRLRKHLGLNDPQVNLINFLAKI